MMYVENQTCFFERNFYMVTDEQVLHANSMDILKVAESLGLPLHKVGKNFRSGKNLAYEFYSDTNRYSNHRTGVQGGSTIDLVQHETGKSFVEAVEHLQSLDLSTVSIGTAPRIKEPFNWYFKTSPTFDRGKDHLVGLRKLPENLINLLAEKRYIVQDKYGQIIFPWYKNGQAVGADVQGTLLRPTEERPYFKQIAKNSESFGFNIKVGSGNVKDIYIFEAPIDLLSYWTLHPKIKDCLLFSVSGTSNYNRVEQVIDYAQATYGMSKDIKDLENSVHICVDNDNEGSKFWKRFDKKNDMAQIVDGASKIYVDERPDPIYGKDWNDVIKGHATEYAQNLTQEKQAEEMEMA